MSRIVQILKKFPVDLGQAEKKHDTAGKRIAFSFVPDGTGKKALDIGCRDGYWSERLKEKGFAVRALDLEPFYPEAITHDVEQGLPYEDNSFDVIWCTEVIEHLRDPKGFLAEVDRVTKPGGVAVFTTPNSNWWLYKVGKLWGWTPESLQNPDHKQFFSEQSIRSIAAGYDLYGYFPYALFFRRISSLIGPLSPTFIFARQKAVVV